MVFSLAGSGKDVAHKSAQRYRILGRKGQSLRSKLGLCEEGEIRSQVEYCSFQRFV